MQVKKFLNEMSETKTPGNLETWLNYEICFLLLKLESNIKVMLRYDRPQFEKKFYSNFLHITIIVWVRLVQIQI